MPTYEMPLLAHADGTPELYGTRQAGFVRGLGRHSSHGARRAVAAKVAGFP